MKKSNSFNIVLLKFYYFFVTILIYPVLVLLAIFIKLLKFKQNAQRNKSLKGQIAVVTGSARGLGRLLAIELAKRGCHVAIVDVLQDLAEETALYISQKYQVKAKSYKVDVSNYQQLVELNNNVTNDLGDVTILINNAAIITLSSLINPTPEEIQNIINVNFTAICFTQQVFLPKMKLLNQGHIVNISSLAALLTSPLLHVYAATKSAVRSLTSALRIEIMTESKNITATTVMPSFLDTNRIVEGLVKNTGMTRFFSLIEGQLVADCVVESMLRNEEEITIPNAILYCLKLVELLPISVKEYVIWFMTAFFINTEKGEDALKKET